MPIATCQCTFRKALSLERNHAMWCSQFISPSQANFNMNENILTYRNFTTQNKLQVCNKVLCARNLLKPLLLSLPNYCCFSYISLILLLIHMTITWSYFYFFFSLLPLTTFRFWHNYDLFWVPDLLSFISVLYLRNYSCSMLHHFISLFLQIFTCLKDSYFLRF